MRKMRPSVHDFNNGLAIQLFMKPETPPSNECSNAHPIRSIFHWQSPLLAAIKGIRKHKAVDLKVQKLSLPVGSMYDIFTYIYIPYMDPMGLVCVCVPFMCVETKSNQANWYANFQPVYESSLVDWFQRDGMTAMPANTSARCSYWKIPNQISLPETKIRLMEEILHQFMWYVSHCLRSFIHPRWCRISSINSSTWKSMVGRLLYFGVSAYF